jgi:hypothetical protein
MLPFRFAASAVVFVGLACVAPEALTAESCPGGFKQRCTTRCTGLPPNTTCTQQCTNEPCEFDVGLDKRLKGAAAARQGDVLSGGGSSSQGARLPISGNRPAISNDRSPALSGGGDRFGSGSKALVNAGNSKSAGFARPRN